MLSTRLVGHYSDVETFYTVKGYEREWTAGQASRLRRPRILIESRAARVMGQ
jgi:hypothetical protein